MASNSNVSITGPLTIRVVDAQTSAENGRKFTKYKVTVSYNGNEWDIWRRYKEFLVLFVYHHNVMLNVDHLHRVYFHLLFD